MRDKLNKERYLFNKNRIKYEIEMKESDNSNKLIPCNIILSK
jgi:hypothetical protein